MLAELFWVFATGLAGSLHCLGMCGPIVIAYSMQLQGNENAVTSAAGGSWAAGLTHHALFHTGRIVSYGLLGGLAAGFVYMGNLGGTLPNMRITTTMTGGILMVLFGSNSLKDNSDSFSGFGLFNTERDIFETIHLERSYFGPCFR